VKKNIMENLEGGSLSYVIVREFLSDLKEEFGGEDDEEQQVEVDMKDGH